MQSGTFCFVVLLLQIKETSIIRFTALLTLLLPQIHICRKHCQHKKFLYARGYATV